jgi:signal transduction histidine kinase
LHDGLAQWLVSAYYSLQLSQAFISMSKLNEAGVEIGRATSVISQSIKELRRVILGLHPTILTKVGLTRALKQHIESLGKETDIVFNFVTKGHFNSLSSMQETNIYRVCLEAINNALKHSGASRIEVHLTVEPDYIFAKVSDDGQGFNLNKVMRNEASGKIGLLSMNEKAEMSSGRLEINTAIGKGTKVSLIIPTTP